MELTFVDLVKLVAAIGTPLGVIAGGAVKWALNGSAQRIKDIQTDVSEVKSDVKEVRGDVRELDRRVIRIEEQGRAA